MNIWSGGAVRKMVAMAACSSSSRREACSSSSIWCCSVTSRRMPSCATGSPSSSVTQREPVEQPALAAVLGADAVLGGAAPGVGRGPRGFVQPRHVLGVHDVDPAEVRVGELLDGVAGDAHVAAGDELVAPGRDGLRAVHHAGDVADRGAQAAFALGLRVQRLVQAGDVDEEADHLGRPAVLSRHEHGSVEHPPRLAVGRDDAVLGLGVGGPGVEVAVQLGDDPVEVVGMHDVRPGPSSVRELRGVVTEQRPEALAQERRVPRFVEVAAVGRARQALDQPADHLLALAQRVLRAAQLGDVADEAFEVLQRRRRRP